MNTIVSQITSLTIVYSTVYSGADQNKHQSSASLAFVWGSHRGPVSSPHKWPVKRKMFPFDDVIMRAQTQWRMSLQRKSNNSSVRWLKVVWDYMTLMWRHRNAYHLHPNLAFIMNHLVSHLKLFVMDWYGRLLKNSTNHKYYTFNPAAHFTNDFPS